MAALASPPKLGNHYIRRLAGTPKPCLICYRPSPTVLVSVSAPTHDFFYVCPSHLTDRHFCSSIPTTSSATSPAATTSSNSNPASTSTNKVSQDEIDKVTREWKERQKAKTEASTSKDKEKEAAPPSKGWLSTMAGAAGAAASTVSSLASAAIASGSEASDSNPADPATTSSPPPAPLPPGQHEHYQLHKDYFAMRKDLFNKRAALKRAQELKMPAVPSALPNLPGPGTQPR
ncbi:hypothetical protein OC845_004518 [Tilletia horrida]|nr:hypothetical protein OC845_004518 [Tilletia horrida]